MRIDSGVDVGLSDQLSDLNIEDQNDLDKPTTTRGRKDDTPPWKLYFQQDDEGDTQLHVAIIQGSVEVAFSLIRMVPSPLYLDLRNDVTQTALHLAVLTSQPRIVRRLVCAGANTRIVDKSGNTPLHLATACGDLLCVRALTEQVTVAEVSAAQLRYVPEPRQPHPPELDVFNYDGLSCIHIALLARELVIMKHLVGFGADIDAREYKSGRTCLHLAVELGDEKLASVLLQDLRADPQVSNYAGETPYQSARRNSSFLQALVAAGAPEEDEYFSSEESDDDDPDMMSYDAGYRSNGVFVDATA
ncbi:NF-kappa-B inhibitor cactus isoform X2 [Cimex lectularius]|nr:NF-kappa-B inhibitor cactus isoform X2 [Cimex lectularius]XP_014250259.1 NF-kappa-B inhibitor cactus isoform X2 [Cimex lectularius]